MNAPVQAAQAPRRIPTLDTLSTSQISAIRAIPPHDQAAPQAIEARRPASMFTDPARFAQEQARVFRRAPVPVTLSARLPSPGAALAHDGYGVPLILARGRDGRVRAFLNACRHKGARLIEGCEIHALNKLTCPYHAWTYALDGALIGVPREETFKNLDRASRGLAELHCREWGGFIWVILDREAAPDFGDLVDDLEMDMAALGLPTAHIYGSRTFRLKANWKLVLEPFLEGYHVQRLHAESIGGLYADTPCVVHRLGRHLRQISGKINFDPSMLDLPGENIHKTVTHAYQLFPSTVVVTSPYYISVMIIMPNGVDRSTVDYFMLTPAPADSEKAEDVYARSYALILKVFGTEDFRAAEISQVGLASGALEDVLYGGLESCIPAYYQTLDSYLHDAT